MKQQEVLAALLSAGWGKQNCQEGKGEGQESGKNAEVRDPGTGTPR